MTSVGEAHDRPTGGANPEKDRGRSADSPSQLPKAGWRDILWRVYQRQSEDNLSIIAAGVSFYILFAIFPALTATVSIYGLISEPATVERQFQAVSSVLPDQARDIIVQQLSAVAGAAGGPLTFGALFSLGLALWSAAKGATALMTALNIAYMQEESRGWLTQTAVALLLTVGAILFLIIALTFVAVLPAVMEIVGLGSGIGPILIWLRWPLLAIMVMIALAVVYRVAPDRSDAQWRWVSWGAAVATVLWLLASVAFSVYVRSFGNYNETYGSMGAVIVLLTWLFLSAYVILLGGELNAEMEHQTQRDTTTGKGRPLGRRGAHVADSVAPTPE